jgi:hypothetical protein
MIKKDFTYKPASDEKISFFQISGDIFSYDIIEKKMAEIGVKDFFIYDEIYIPKMAGMSGHPIQKPKYTPDTHNIFVAYGS